MGLFEELKRRNVFRVAAAYLVASWLLIEASSVLLEAFGAPEWVPKTVAILLAIGFPIALFFAWAFEVTPEGVKREADVDRTQSITSHTARRLDLMTMALLVAAIVLFLSEGYWRPDGGERSAMTTAVGDQPVVSIAVLPFENMSADAENEYFADGISEEILNLLAGVRDLEVASRTSAFAYKGTSSSIPDIASALGVRYVLEGSVRKAGEQVRITAQLIDSSNDRHLWSETYDRTLNDIFAIQDEIAGAIGAALQVELLGASGQRVTVETIDPELYADFLEARHLLRRRNYTDMAAALELLRGVVVTEPDFARGQAILSEAYMHNGLGADAPLAEGMAFTRAREHADRAIALNPDLAVPYTVLALITQWGGGDKLAALEYYGRAIELEPDEPRAYHWRGILYGQAGYVALAEADFRRGLELEPENANLNGEMAQLAMMRGDLDEGLVLSLRQAELGNPARGYSQAAYVELWRGNLETAAAYFEQARPYVSDATRAFQDAVMGVVLGDGDQSEVRALLPATDSIESFDQVVAMLILGMHEELLGIVARSNEFLRHRDLAGRRYLMWNEEFRPFRQDPRFVHQFEDSDLVSLWREYGPPADCRAEGESYRCGYGFGEE